MEMEGSGGSQSQLTHPAAVDVTKRERKRSRYLSPPYTDTAGVQEKKAAGSSQKQREEEEEGPPHVSASEVLSALRAAALEQGEGMDAAALRFLAMYSSNRNRNSIFDDDHPDSHAAAGGGSQDDGGKKPPSVSAAGVGRKMLNLNAGPDGGSLAKKKNPPPPVMTTVTPLVNNEKKRRNKQKRLKTAVGQRSYVGNPVALVLDFAEGTPLPSREDLLSTFSRFGVVIESETTISQDKHAARVAFATRAQAEAALSCAATLGGAFGPPSAVASLHDLPPITPLRKLPLTQEANAKTAVDSLSLVGEMQHLLAKVDKVLQVQRASAAAHHHA